MDANILTYRIATTIALLLVLASCDSEDGFVDCTGQLIEYLAERPYYEELDGVHSHYIADFATFKVVSPSEYRGRRFQVIFLSTQHNSVQNDLAEGVGDIFKLRMPLDYFGYPDETKIKGFFIEKIEVNN